MFFQSEYNQPPLLPPPDNGRTVLVLIRLIFFPNTVVVIRYMYMCLKLQISFAVNLLAHCHFLINFLLKKSSPVIKSERRANLFICFHTWISLRMCGDSSSFTAKKKLFGKRFATSYLRYFIDYCLEKNQQQINKL